MSQNEFDCFECENCYNCNECYFCNYCENCEGTSYSYFCENCSGDDVCGYFLYHCKNCDASNNCFHSHNLYGKEYVFKNIECEDIYQYIDLIIVNYFRKQYPEEEIFPDYDYEQFIEIQEKNESIMRTKILKFHLILMI